MKVGALEETGRHRPSPVVDGRTCAPGDVHPTAAEHRPDRKSYMGLRRSRWAEWRRWVFGAVTTATSAATNHEGVTPWDSREPDDGGTASRAMRANSMTAPAPLVGSLSTRMPPRRPSPRSAGRARKPRRWRRVNQHVMREGQHFHGMLESGVRGEGLQTTITDALRAAASGRHKADFITRPVCSAPDPEDALVIRRSYVGRRNSGRESTTTSRSWTTLRFEPDSIALRNRILTRTQSR